MTEKVSEAVFAFHPRKCCAVPVLPVTWPHQIEQKSSTMAKTQPKPNTLRNDINQMMTPKRCKRYVINSFISRERIPAISIFFFLISFENIFCLWTRTGCEAGGRISFPSLSRLLHTICFCNFLCCIRHCDSSRSQRRINWMWNEETSAETFKEY